MSPLTEQQTRRARRSALGRSTAELRRRVVTGLAIFAALLAAGTAGYMLIERWSLMDSFFMTITTVTTVGYREVRPLDTEGRIFTTFLVLFGVGTAFYLLTTFVALVIEGDLGEALGLTRMRSRIEQLRGHHILCGYGRVGEEVAREFSERNMPFVVIESNPEAISRAIDDNRLVVEGDAAEDDVLMEAGVLRARTLLAASDSDSGNTYITLSAKALNPEIFVIARAGKLESEARALRAGADRVISPYVIGGRRMALSAIDPSIVEVMDTLAGGAAADRIVAEIEVTEESGLAGASLREISDAPGLVLLGLQRAGGELVVGVPDELRVAIGDRLMVAGPEREVARVTRQDRRNDRP